MKKFLFTGLFLICLLEGYSQTIYYWVGSAPGAGDSLNKTTNWNTALNGTGSPRTSNSTATDILIFDGTNLGGATPVTGVVTVNAGASITCAQMKFVNNANIRMIRGTSGTSTITLSGSADEDFIIEAGSTLSVIPTTSGSIVFAMAAANTGRVSGTMSIITPQQFRIANTTAGTGNLIFTSGSSFTTNITAGSASYAFGNSTQSSEKWVVFESGSHLYYEGGFSPHGSGTLFSAIDMKSGSTWHHRATNGTSGVGNFFNRKNFGNVIVENNANLIALGTVYSIENLTINTGSTFTTASTGQTVVLGNIVANGDLLSNTGSTNNLVLAGSTTQTISGLGNFNVGGLIIADKADIVLNKSITVQNTATVYGKINFNNYQITGTSTFNAISNASASSLTGNTITGRYFIGPVTGFNSSTVGLTVTGAGVAPNTTVVSYSAALDTIYVSKPLLAVGTGVSFSFSSQNATLETANPNGFDPVSGSVAVTGIKNYGPGINYIIDAATATPFGISPSPNDVYADINDLIVNAAVTTNTKAHISGTLQLNTGKITIRTTDSIHLTSTATLAGSFNSAKYIVTEADNSSGAQGIFRYDGRSASTLFPVGSPARYLPVTITPATTSDFAVAVFEGITNQGTPNGTPLTSTQKQTKVDAVWNINRVNGSGSADIVLQWDQALEGSTFTTLPDNEIGVIVNLNPGWSLPTTTGNNTTNTAPLTVTGFGAFGVGALPPAQPFTFNALPVKTYGDPDFNGGAISANTTNPIVYTSSNPAVATIVGGNIHITGTGVTNITATQASDGFYPAANVTQQLTVNKANLTIKADDKIKPEGDPLPPLTITYTGFAYGETPSVFTTPVVITTTATASSLPGTYPITVSGATATNYNITFVNGVMTVTPKQTQTITFNAFPVKTYGNADFAIGATSTNNTIPITYSSSNTGVATIVGNNIHIVGAGTTTITASQAGSPLYFPAPNVSQILTVNKANLTVRAVDTTKNYGEPNPAFRLVFTGFVLGQNTSALTTVPVATTTATTTSAPGYYAITPANGVAANYNFIYIAGRLTINPASGVDQYFLQAYMSGTNTLTVKVFSPAPDIAEVILYDFSGRKLIQRNVFLPQGFVTSEFSVVIPAAGIYVVRVVSKQTTLEKKIFITK